jgi:hypothetical protein
VELTGRVFARAELLKQYEPYFDTAGVPRVRPVTSFDLSIPSARLGAHFRTPKRYVTGEIDLELTDKPKLEDAWLRAKSDYFALQLGQFKVPFSAIEMESRWVLPTASRGLVHDLLLRDLEVAGRRPGAAVSGRWRPKKRGLSATLGTFQGSVLVEQEGTRRQEELFSRQSLRTQSLVARAEYAFEDLTLGAGAERRVGTPGILRSERYNTAGVDATLDTSFRGRGVRFWLEGIVGESWFEHSRKPTDARDPLFASARLIGAVRFGGARKNAPYLEPYAMVGVLDPDTEVALDLATEEVVGVNVGLWKLTRLGLEGSLEHFERNFPRAYGLGANPNRRRVLLQAGAQF